MAASNDGGKFRRRRRVPMLQAFELAIEFPRVR